MRFTSFKPPVALLLVALLLIVFIIYFPGLAGDFFFDDFVNVVTNTNAHLNDLSLAEIGKVTFSGVASTLARPLAMLTFGLNYYFTELNPFYYKLTNLCIHLVSAVGVFLLSKELLAVHFKDSTTSAIHKQYLALFITACWALHPLNVSSVLYVVQRMTLLSAACVIFGLVYFCRFRRREHCTRGQGIRALVFLTLFILAGVLCKENAVLLPLFVLAIEVFIFRFDIRTDGHRTFFKYLMIVFIIIPAALALVVLVISPDRLLAPYEVRSFTLEQRVMTEARILWIYLRWLILPNISEFVFHYDNFPVSKTLFDPLTTLPALAGLVAVLVLTWTLRKKYPLLCFGLAFFAAGHVLESSVIALELLFEHRNYLPGFGIIFGVVTTVWTAANFVLGKRSILLVSTVYLLFLADGTFEESRKWSNTRDHLVALVRNNPGSHRINHAVGYMYLTLAGFTPDNSALFDMASEYYRHAAELDDTALRGHVGVIIADSQNGKAIDPLIVRQVEQRLANNHLIDDGMKEISQLTECWYGGLCVFDKNILAGFYSAIATNTTDPPIVIQAVLDQLGTAVATVFGSPEDGLALLYLAKSRSSGPTVTDLKIIRTEMELGNIARAREVLQDTQSKVGDRSSLHAELKALEVRLRELEQVSQP